jgi:hypothetical protein
MVRALIFLTALLSPVVAVNAQEASGNPIETLDLTMKLMPEGASLPEAVTRVIELPPAVVETAEDNAANGLGQANAARENRQTALDRAAEAGEQGRERAQEVREDVGRGRGPFDAEPPGPPDLPGDRPGPGGPPDTPGPPGN